MAISINLRMTREEWVDFAYWLDERYSSNWRFYRDHENIREQLHTRPWDEPGTYHNVGPTGSIGNTIVLGVDGDAEAEEFALIKMFNNTATVITRGRVF